MSESNVSFLREIIVTGKLRAFFSANELSFLIPLTLVCFYYVIFMLLLSLCGMPPVYSLALLLVCLSNLLHLCSCKLRYFLTFKRTALLNPQSVQSSFQLRPKEVLERFPYLYPLGFCIDLLFVGLLLAAAPLATFALLPAAILVLHLGTFIHDQLRLAPIRRASRAFLANHNTDLFVFVSGIPGTEYQLEQWIGVLERLRPELNVTINLRETHFLRYGTGLSLPTLRMEHAGDLYRFVASGQVKAIFYLNNSVYNQYTLIFRDLLHIHINHGDSDKAANALNTSHDYDYVFIAGQASVDRHLAADWRPEKLVKIGRPQLARFSKLRSESKSSDKKTVLYAPTFEGNKEMDCYSSLTRMGYELVSKILGSGNYRVLVKLHPYTGRFQRAYRLAALRLRQLVESHASAGHQWIPQDETGDRLYQLFIASDVLISDVSSVAIDYLALDRPILATNPDGLDPLLGAKKFPFWRGAHVVGMQDDPLLTLDQALENDPKAAARRELARYYLGEGILDPEKMVEQFKATVVGMIATGKQNLDVLAGTPDNLTAEPPSARASA